MTCEEFILTTTHPYKKEDEKWKESWKGAAVCTGVSDGRDAEVTGWQLAGRERLCLGLLQEPTWRELVRQINVNWVQTRPPVPGWMMCPTALCGMEGELPGSSPQLSPHLGVPFSGAGSPVLYQTAWPLAIWLTEWWRDQCLGPSPHCALQKGNTLQELRIQLVVN